LTLSQLTLQYKSVSVVLDTMSVTRYFQNK